jgi:hypothetical protein
MLLLACCVFFIAGVSLEAQWRQPFSSLRVIKTERFDIVFPPESEKTAQTLAGFADQVYGEVSGMLGISVSGRIPVILTPHTDNFNGYVNPVPYPHIVLLDTPMPIENMGAYTNSLKGLFLHELTHVVSLSSRSPGLEGLYKVFGGWVFPVIFTAPAFMVEGVTVSFESLDGTGRAHDPLIKEGLIQAIHENAFFTPLQATGLYDLPHLASGAYHYGGFFSSYLQERYGMEKYAELWRAMGGGKFRVSFNVYDTGFYDLFQTIYGRRFPDAWDEFKESLRITGIEENTGPRLFDGASRRRAALTAMDAGGGKVFAADNVSGKVIAFDPVSQKLSNLINAGRAVQDLAVSDDGGRLLLSSYRNAGSLNYVFNEERAVLTEYDTRHGRKTGRTWKGIRDARYFRDGVIGIAADRHLGNIVYLSGGNEETLLGGTGEILYSNPSPLNDVWIAFTAAKRGARELCLYNYDTREVYRFVSELEDDGDRWKYIRGLGFYEGRILFSYNHDGKMYKLGMVDPSAFLNGTAETFEAFFSERDFSGGVFLPVMAEGGIYYRGAFTAGDALLRYPEAKESGVYVPLSLKPWDEGDRRAADLPEEPSPLPSSRFWGIKYLNPFKFWIPYPLFRQDPNAALGMTVNGPAIFSLMMDPTDTNQIMLNAAMDIPYLMGDVSLTWLNLSFGFPLTFGVTDTMDTRRTLYPGAIRETGFNVQASFTRGLGDSRLLFTFAPEAAVRLLAPGPRDLTSLPAAPESAYTWVYEPPYYIGVLGLGLSNLSQANGEAFGQGFSLAAYGKYALRHSEAVESQALPRFEGILRTAFEPYLPLQFRLYGAWDERGMNLAGESPPFSSTAFGGFASAEYVNAGNMRMQDIQWLGGGEAEVKLFLVEVQRNLSHIYFNRFMGTLAYRGVVYDDRGHPAAEGNVLTGSYRLAQSLVLRLKGIASFAVLPYIPFRLSASFIGVWKISNVQDGKNGNDFWFGPEITFSF